MDSLLRSAFQSALDGVVSRRVQPGRPDRGGAARERLRAAATGDAGRRSPPATKAAPTVPEREQEIPPRRDRLGRHRDRRHQGRLRRDPLHRDVRSGWFLSAGAARLDALPSLGHRTPVD